MNIEELKLILETINSVSHDASTAAIWWMALHYGSMVFGWILFASTVFGVVYTVAGLIISNSEWGQLGRQVSKAYGGNGGTYVYGSDEKAIADAIEKAKQ